MKQQESIIIQVLQKIPLFDGLHIPALEQLTKIAEDKSFPKDQIIFQEGSQGNSMMIIINGEIRITQVSANSHEEALCVLQKGDFFGEMALLENQPRSATAIAQNDVYLLEIRRDNFLRFLRYNPAEGVTLLYNLARILSSRLREADSKIKAFVNFSQWV